MNVQQIPEQSSFSSQLSLSQSFKIDQEQHIASVFQDSLKYPQTNYTTRVPSKCDENLKASCIKLTESSFIRLVVDKIADSRNNQTNLIKCREAAADKGLTENSEDGSLSEHFLTKRNLEETKEDGTYGYSDINRITKEFFSLDWDSKDLKYMKLSSTNSAKTDNLKELFTANVHWHYINNQYFPINLFSYKIDLFLDQIRSKLTDSINKQKDNYQNLLKFLADNPSTKSLTLDQLIDISPTEMETSCHRNKEMRIKIVDRVEDSFNCNNLATKNLLHAEDYILTSQTIKSFAKYTQTLNEEAILRDSIYHNGIDSEYLERKEKALRAEDKFGLPKKYAHYAKGRSTRSYSNFQISETEIPLEPKFLLYNHTACQVCTEEHNNPSNRLLICSVSCKE